MARKKGPEHNCEPWDVKGERLASNITAGQKRKAKRKKRK